jgi:hypothetical protein
MLFSQRTGIWIAGFIAHVALAIVLAFKNLSHKDVPEKKGRPAIKAKRPLSDYLIERFRVASWRPIGTPAARATCESCVMVTIFKGLPDSPMM